jgi:hypothetical protein
MNMRKREREREREKSEEGGFHFRFSLCCPDTGVFSIPGRIKGLLLVSPILWRKFLNCDLFNSTIIYSVPTICPYDSTTKDHHLHSSPSCSYLISSIKDFKSPPPLWQTRLIAYSIFILIFLTYLQSPYFFQDDNRIS